MFRRYLKVADTCPQCGEALHHQRADDAPPYFTIVIVGHVVVGLVLAVEMAYRPPLWVHAALWLPLTVILTLLVLPLVKGALVALQWALLMHGFDPDCQRRNGGGLRRRPDLARIARAALTSGPERVGSGQICIQLIEDEMAKPVTQKIKLVSTAGTGYYYVTKKNPRNQTEKLVFKKYDPVARKHVEFKESKIK